MGRLVMINYVRKGDIVVASGYNWKYEQVGDVVAFTQSGKVPSLRVIKVMIKLLGKVSIPPLPSNSIYQGGGGQCNYHYGYDGSALISSGGGMGGHGYKSTIRGNNE